jgi:hypothetical protein
MTEPRATPAREDDSALLRVLEAHIETLKAENEILTRRLAAAETLAAQETAKAEGVIAELSALTRIRARVAREALLSIIDAAGAYLPPEIGKDELITRVLKATGRLRPPVFVAPLRNAASCVFEP